MVVLTPADQERIRSFVNRWHEELRNAADEMNLDPSELAVFVGKMFVSIPKASRPRRAIDVYKREVYATHKGTGKDALDKGILAEISNGWKVIKEDKARLEEYEERARATVRDVNRDVHVRGSSLLKDANKIIKVMNNLADSLSQTTGSEALIVITNRLPGLHPMADLQGSNRAVIAARSLGIMDTLHRWASEVIHEETRKFMATQASAATSTAVGMYVCQR